MNAHASRTPKVTLDDANDTVDALVQAEAFISGFEDDEQQEGIADILAGLRTAIDREQAAPDLLAALKELRVALPVISLADPKVQAADDKARAAVAKAEGSLR